METAGKVFEVERFMVTRSTGRLWVSTIEKRIGLPASPSWICRSFLWLQLGPLIHLLPGVSRLFPPYFQVRSELLGYTVVGYNLRG
jgi:hypothetical protein